VYGVIKAREEQKLLVPVASYALLASAVGVSMLWCIASFWFPFGWDQGMFASVGDVIVRGGMPYRDGWETRGPLPFYLFAAAQSLFGRHMWSIRIFDIPLLITGMFTLGSLVARLTSRIAGCWAALTLAFWIASLTWFHTAEPDVWAAILVTVGLAPLFHRTQVSLSRLLAAGLLVGIAGLVKPVNLGFVVIPLLVLLQQERSAKSGLTRAGAVTAMMFLPVALAVTWFGYRGALGALVNVHILYPVKVYSGIAAPKIGDLARSVLHFFLDEPVLFALPVVIIGGYSLWRKSRNLAVLVLAWLGMALLGIVMQGKFFKYHWVALFAPIIIMGVFGVHSLLIEAAAEARNRSTESLRLIGRVAVALAAIGVLQLATVSVSAVGQWLKLVTGNVNSEQYYGSHHAGAFVAGDDMKTARYIQERTKPSDGVVVFGNNALINFLSGRANPTRFLTAGSMTFGRAGSIRDAYRQEYISGIRRAPPAYVVLGVAYNGSKEKALQGFPELDTLLHEQYTLDTHIGYLDLYRSNSH
jgi:hypothetical protein